MTSYDTHEAVLEAQRRTQDARDRQRWAEARVSELQAEIAVEIDTIVPDHTYTGDEVIATLRALTFLLESSPPCEPITALKTPAERP